MRGDAMSARVRAAWLSLACVLAACVGAESNAVHYRGRFTARPVRVVIAPGPWECLPTFERVQAWYASLRVRMTLEPAQFDSPLEQATPGTVLVVWGQLSAGKRGETLRMPTLLGDIRAALVTLALGECRESVIAHELGHALGLKDVWGAPGNLMCGSVTCIEESERTYTPAQHAWIAEP